VCEFGPVSLAGSAADRTELEGVLPPRRLLPRRDSRLRARFPMRSLAKTCLAAGFLLAACASLPARRDPLESTVAGVAVRSAPERGRHASVEGRPLRHWVFGSGLPVTLVFAGIHGSERSSVELATRFLEVLDGEPDSVDRGTIVVAPLVNPDGYERGERWNARGVDLNRNFPAWNWDGSSRGGPRPASEPETRFVLGLLERFRPTRVVSVHAPLACVNWDGPARRLARALSQESGLPRREDIGYPTPGSFGSYAGRQLGIPTITLELPDRDRLAPERLPRLVRTLLLAHHGARAPLL
jgi:murein peptide amidase A